MCPSAPCRARLHSGTPGKHVLILQLHNGLHSPVVVVQVDRPHHLGPLQVPNLYCDLADGVTANELDDLLSGGVARIHFNGGQLDILKQEYTRQHSECLSTLHPSTLSTPPLPTDRSLLSVPRVSGYLPQCQAATPREEPQL